ncbi:Arginine--tRNA ligase [Streptomyces sp. YIM 130001]|uniref:ArgS-related anticodon-binding protein NrtL n=1 Tax=Streptomyces sp. YIM 130001 TaxID=2259644 RepID=UPI000E6533BC|nr:DALR anticodon-binding domain-containing protein [Streptomyces sp. YIM 130001]RII15778.1 Arginine--tRNA ligase [Streptomyces sp. YIM 130001]
MTPVELSRTVLRAVRRAVDDGELSVAVPARAVVERPRPGGCGDYATNVALQLAGPAGRPPRAVAEAVRSALVREPAVAEVTVTGPGFLNITLDPAQGDPEALRSAIVREIRARTAQSAQYGHVPLSRYGHGDVLAGEQLELRVPRELRAELVAETLSRIAATQGATSTVTHSAPHNLRPVPAPTDIHTALSPRAGTGAHSFRPASAPEFTRLPAAPLTDAIRWTLLHPAPHDHPRPLHEHLAPREANPLFRVQYAHAGTRALTRNATALGFTSTPPDSAPDSSTSPPESHPLVEALAAHPQALASAARHRAPDRLARHLLAVADALLAYRHTVLPLGDEKPSAAHRDRLALAEAAGTVLAGGLSLLGISSPEHL